MIGYARAETPLLEKPLEGPVYLRTGGGHKLPDIVAALNGQIDIDLDGHVDTVKGAHPHHFRNRARRSRFQFTLNLDGGRKGLLENNTSLCSHSLHAIAKITGQNGKSANQNPTLQTPCRASRLMRARRFERRGQARAGWRSR